MKEDTRARARMRKDEGVEEGMRKDEQDEVRI